LILISYVPHISSHYLTQDKRDDHFVVMARFANECLKAFQELTGQLEIALGPE
jgi:hypothetical protein